MSKIGMLFGSFLGCPRNWERKLQRLSTTSNHPSAFDATSALCHKERLEEVQCDDWIFGFFDVCENLP